MDSIESRRAYHSSEGFGPKARDRIAVTVFTYLQSVSRDVTVVPSSDALETEKIKRSGNGCLDSRSIVRSCMYTDSCLLSELVFFFVVYAVSLVCARISKT